MVSRGFKIRASFLGFFEILIWILVVAELFKSIDNWVNYIAYAGGFATGTYVGMYLESKLKVGTIIVRIITSSKFTELTEALKAAGFTVTTLDAEGGFGPVKIIFTVLKRRKWNQIVSIIEANDPSAFYSSEDVKYASSLFNGVDVLEQRSPTNRLLGLRKGI